MPQQQAPPPAAATVPTSAPRSSSDRHVYRLDFVLTATEGGGAPTSTAFSLNLQEPEKGEMNVGKNVPINPPPPPGSGSTGPSPRQDVGLKVAASYRTTGEDLVLDVALEMSTFDPPSTVRKVVAKGNALAAASKPALVTTLEADNKHYQLVVTPTKLR